MDVTREDVLRCARLASLSLLDSEVEPLRQAMTTMLSRAEALDALDLTDVAPVTHGRELPLPRREDLPAPGFTQAEALVNAPETGLGHFLVPKVL